MTHQWRDVDQLAAFFEVIGPKRERARQFYGDPLVWQVAAYPAMYGRGGIPSNPAHGVIPSACGHNRQEIAMRHERVNDDEVTGEMLRAIAEPHRRAILQLVSHDELTAGEIAAAFEVTRTAVSQHLTVLKNAGLLAERRHGTRRLYRARPEGLAELRAFLDDTWASALDVGRGLVESERGVRESEHRHNAG